MTVKRHTRKITNHQRETRNHNRRQTAVAPASRTPQLSKQLLHRRPSKISDIIFISVHDASTTPTTISRFNEIQQDIGTPPQCPRYQQYLSKEPCAAVLRFCPCSCFDWSSHGPETESFRSDQHMVEGV